MKLFTLAVICTAFLPAGQLKAQDNMSLGPKAGFGHSWMNGSNNRYQPFGQVGATFTYSPMSHIGFGADLLYSIEGGKHGSGANNVITKLDYLRLPLTLKYFFGNYGDKIRPRVEIGPSVGFLVGGNQVVETANKGELLSRTAASNIARRVDIGLTVGAGVNYRVMTNTWLLADVNYYNGFADIYPSAVTARNRSLGFNLGLAFGIGKQ